MRWLLALVGCLAATCSLAATDVPYVPARDDVVLQTVPSFSDPRVRALDVLRRQLIEQPREQQRAVKLSEGYLDYGRDTGDARYLGRAEAVLAPWLALSPAPIPVLLVHATILQSRHDFDGARAQLQSILLRDGDNAQAWLTLASVDLVQGQLSAARRACAHLLESSDQLVPAGCLSSLNAVNGHADNAYQVLSLMWPQAQAESVAVQSWLQGILADSAKYLGSPLAADQHFRAALQLSPGDNFLLADYADFLLDEGRAQQALNLVKDYSQSDTSFLRQVYAEQMLGASQKAADAAQMASRFAALEIRGTYAYRREEAGFALRVQHQPVRALRLALQNWTVQRAPEDIQVLLAAALAAAQPAAAQPALDQLASSHLQYPVVLALAAQVRAALGHADSGNRASLPQSIASEKTRLAASALR
jgi:hypothetical protein